MKEPHLVIVGGGLAGLSTGCYARASGFRTTIVEHGANLGGVCTAWSRGPYIVDGCIHWLTGGPFARLYTELGILPELERRVLDEWMTYRSAPTGTSIHFTRRLDALRDDLLAISPDDAAEIDRVIASAHQIADLSPPLEHPRELTSLREQLVQLWEMRHQAGTMMHFRKPLAAWAHERIRSPELRRLLCSIVPEQVPALFLCMVLGYLERGHLSRPVGGTARFRDALIARYQRAGGEAKLHATVEEILVEDGRVRGVRLADGTLLSADVVVSTSSLPETALRLLGGRYAADEVRHRIETWEYLGPIVLASFGVAAPLRELPPLWIIDRVDPFLVGDQTSDRLYVRITNDAPELAPANHVVVQTLLPTSYDWWATCDSRYGNEKEAIAETALLQLERYIPGLRGAVKMIDVATPLTFWTHARSWRGAFEGWLPERENPFAHVRKTLGDLRGLYLAGQWVEPGGGVPTAIMSGRQAAQLACADQKLAFRAPLAV